MVIGINKKGHKQKFSDLAWRYMLPEDAEGYRSGYKESATQTAQNTLKKQLPTGESQAPAPVAKPGSKQKAANTLNDGKATQKAANTLKQEQEVDTRAIKDKIFTQAEKDDFLEAADGVSRGTLKEYFERPEVAIKYNKKANTEELLELLGESLAWDINKFQKIFEN